MYTAQDYIEFIKQGRRDKISPSALDIIAKDSISKSHVLERLDEIEIKLVHLKYNFETIELDAVIDRIDQLKKELSWK